VADLRIVLGLGNPGRRYDRTRHNIGFRVLDRLAAHLRAAFELPDDVGRRVWVGEANWHSRLLVLAKPRTYMNRSGRAAGALCARYEAEARQFLVVCDDADLSLGRVRIRGTGRPGGHNGLRSLIDVFGTEEFARVKLGVRGAGREACELADYVLAPFEPEEEPRVERLVELGAQAVLGVLETGLAQAMNRYNGLTVDDDARSDGSSIEE